MVIKLGKDVLEFPDDTDPKTVVHAASSHARQLLMSSPDVLEKLTPQERDDVYNIAAVGTKPNLNNFTPSAIVSNLKQRAEAATMYAKDNPLSTIAELAPAAAGILLPNIVRGIKSGMRPPTPGTTQTVTKWEGGNPWSSNAGQARPQSPAQLPSGAPAEPAMVGAQGTAAGSPPPITRTDTTTQLTPPDPGGILRRAGGLAGDIAKYSGGAYLLSKFFGSHSGSSSGGGY